MRGFEMKYVTNPVLIRWQTKAAEFLQIEISPSHIFRIKIDKGEKGKGGKEAA